EDKTGVTPRRVTFRPRPSQQTSPTTLHPCTSFSMFFVTCAIMESRGTRSPRDREGGDEVDFVAVLDQVIALLRQRGRLTYRTLQRQFQLDDAALEDLKLELIEGQCLAIDERGTVLVWTGGGAAL